MNDIALKLTCLLLGSVIAVAACNGDDDDDDGAATGGAGGSSGSGGTAGAGQTGSGGVAATGSGGTGGGAGIAGGSATFDEDCAKMCEVVLECETRGLGDGGAAGAAGAGAVTPGHEQCLADCEFIADTLSTEPCRSELEAYFACLGSVDPNAVECADGFVRWDLYCVAETAAALDCQDF